MSVGIPGFDRVGLKYAAALGACLGNPEKGLQLLEAMSGEVRAQAVRLVEENRVSVTVAGEEEQLYVRAQVTTGRGVGVSVIRNSHANIVFTSADGRVLLEKSVCRAAATSCTKSLKP